MSIYTFRENDGVGGNERKVEKCWWRGGADYVHGNNFELLNQSMNNWGTLESKDVAN